MYVEEWARCCRVCWGVVTQIVARRQSAVTQPGLVLVLWPTLAPLPWISCAVSLTKVEHICNAKNQAFLWLYVSSLPSASVCTCNTVCMCRVYSFSWINSLSLSQPLHFSALSYHALLNISNWLDQNHEMSMVWFYFSIVLNTNLAWKHKGKWGSCRRTLVTFTPEKWQFKCFSVEGKVFRGLYHKSNLQALRTRDRRWC